MTIYTHNGAYPTKLPFRIILPDGRSRTDPTTFSATEISDAGYTAVDDKPTVTDTQVLEWNNTNADWVIRDKTAEELELERMAGFNPLNPAQFEAILSLIGITVEQIDAAIDSVITDPPSAAFAKAKVRKATAYHRDNELFDLLVPVMQITNEEIDTAWLQAQQFR